MIEDRPDVDRTLLAIAIRESLDRQGWLAALGPDEIDQGVEDEIALIELIAGAFAVGSTIGRRGTQVHQRRRRGLSALRLGVCDDLDELLDQ